VGIVEGKLSDNGNKIEGNWKNKYNEFGKFIFQISLDGKTFEGNYSMQNEKVTISSNSWNGKRVY
jgi:hypothetical protein